MSFLSGLMTSPGFQNLATAVQQPAAAQPVAQQPQQPQPQLFQAPLAQLRNMPVSPQVSPLGQLSQFSQPAQMPQGSFTNNLLGAGLGLGGFSSLASLGGALRPNG